MAAPAGVILLFVGWRLARWARRRAAPQPLLAVMGVVAVAVFLLSVTALGFRHYGGHTPGSGAYKCDAWWAQMGSSNGVADGGGGAFPWCKRAAEGAVVPGLAEAGTVGLLVGTAAAVVVRVRRRRFDAQLEDLTRTSSGSAP
ncbi:MAG TPA: hypothetical protein VGH43_08745 [Jatrophihabitans sp.]